MRHSRGTIFCFAVAAYGLGRCYLESLRDDEAGGRDTTLLQLTSMLPVIAALAGLALIWRWKFVVRIAR